MIVTKANQTITFETLAKKIYGDTAFDLAATNSAPLAVVFTSSNTGVATISGHTLTINGAGVSTITASQPGDTNYNAATAVNQTLTVGKASQTIIFEVLSAKTFGDAPFAVSATGGGSGNNITFTSSDQSRATCSGATGSFITIIGAGSCSITAHQEGNENYTSAQPVTQILTLNKLDQTISFDAITEKTYGDVPFDLVASSSANLAVAFTSSNSSVATISGNTVTIVGAGTSTIQAAQEGTGNFAAAAAVQRTLTVGKSDQILTLNSLPVGDVALKDVTTAIQVSAFSSSGLPVVISLGAGSTGILDTDNKLTGIAKTGSVIINVSQSGNANFNDATLSQSFDVTKSQQTIDFSVPETIVYAPGLSIDLSAVASSDLPVTFTILSGPATLSQGNHLNISASGIINISASQGGNASWNPATTVNRTISVGKAVQNITLDPLPDKNYGDAPFKLTAFGGASGIPILFTSSDNAVATCSGLNGATVTIIGAGTCTIYANQAGSSSFLPAQQVSRTLTVKAIALELTTVTVTSIGVSTAFSGGNISSDGSSQITARGVCWSTSQNPTTADTKTTDGTGTGVYSSSITGLTPGTLYYVRAYATNAVGTTYGKQVSLTSFQLAALSAMHRTFGQAPFILTNPASLSTGTFSYTSSKTGTATVSGNTVTVNGAGTSTITVTQAASGAYASATSTGTLTVDKAIQVLTLDPLPVGAVALKDVTDPIQLSASSSSGLPVTISLGLGSTGSLDASNQLTNIGKTGNVVIVVSQAGNKNYLSETLTASFDVVKANQTITFAALPNKTSGDASFALSASASSGLEVRFVSSDSSVATISGNIVTIVGAGTATISASQEGNATWNPATKVNRILNVGTAAQTISFDALGAKTYGDDPFSLTAAASSGLGLTYSSNNPAVATVLGDKVTIIGAGSARITALQAGNDNFGAAPEVSQILTVNKALLTVTANAKTKTYGSSNPLLTFSYTGWKNSQDESVLKAIPVAVTTVDARTNAGIYSAAITVSGAVSVNYSFTYIPADFTVTKAMLTVSADAKTKVYGATVPVLTFSYSGWKNGQDETVLGTKPQIATSVTQTSNAGVYDGGINISGGQDEDYAFTYVPANMVVTKANQTITFETQTFATFGDDPILLAATTTSPLEVAFSSSNIAVANISGTILTIKGAGTSVITAYQSGDANYNAATAVNHTLFVDKAYQAVVVGKTAQNINLSATDTRTYGDNPYTLPADGGNSGNPVIFTSSDPSVATCTGATGSTITIIGGGICKITAAQEGNANFDGASASQTLTVLKAAQSISFATTDTRTYGELPYTLQAAGGNSSNPVRFNSSNSSVATISGNTLTISGTGTTVITATQAGNNNFTASADVTQILTVVKAGQIITLQPFTDGLVLNTLIGKTVPVSAVSSSGLPVSISLGAGSPATLSLVNNAYIMSVTESTGTIVVNIDQPGNDNYNPAHISESFDVSKANQSITFNAILPVIYSYGQSVDLIATASSGLPISFSVISGPATLSNGNHLNISGAGLVAIAARQSGSNIWNQAPDVNQVLVISKGIQNITFDPLPDKNNGDAPFTIIAIGDASGNPVVFTSSDPTIATCSELNGSTITLKNPGTCTIYANQAGNNTYLNATQIGRKLTIHAMSASISTKSVSSISATTAYSGGYISSNGGEKVTARGVCWSTTQIPTTDNFKTIDDSGSGLYSSQITGLTPGTTYYVRAYAVNALGTTYGDQLSFTPFELASLADIHKTFGDAAFRLDDPSSPGSGAFSFSSSKSTVATISGHTVTITGAGSAIITATQAASGAYATTFTSGLLKVDKAGQILTLDPLSIGSSALKDVVGAIQLSASSSSGLPVTISLGSGSTGTINSSNQLTNIGQTGEVVINVDQAGNNNYLAASISQSFDVLKTNQAITFDALAHAKYGDPAFTLSATATSGLPVNFISSNPLVATVSGNKVNIVSAGTTTITASQNGDESWNPANSISRALTVDKADQKISFEAIYAKSYGDAPLTLVASSTSLLSVIFTSSNTSVATIKGNILTIVGVGNATITASQAGGNNFEAASESSQNLTVNIPMLIVSAYSQFKTYGSGNPLLTIAYSGWRNGDDESAFITKPTASTFVDETTPVGVYNQAIQVAGGVIKNYNVVYQSGAFIVKKKTVTPVILARNKNYDGTKKVDFSSLTLNGILFKDEVTLLSTSAEFENSMPGKDKKVYAYFLTLGGSSANNYQLSQTTASTVAEIYPLPIPTISGLDKVCQKSDGMVYSTEKGMTNYVWGLTYGGVITSGAGTNTITVIWNQAGAQTISVNYTNINGGRAKIPVLKNIFVKEQLIPVISGSETISAVSTGNVYTTETGMTNYSWTISSGGKITTGAGSNSITTSWNTLESQSVSVTYMNTDVCLSSKTIYDITMRPLPGIISNIYGNADVCGGSMGIVFAASPSINATTYIWTLPAGATIVSGEGTPYISINFTPNAASGNITVFGRSADGDGKPTVYYINVNQIPVAPGNITGSASVCQGSQGVSYSIPTMAYATDYEWTIPYGAKIVSGENTNKIVVDFSDTAVSGSISVRGKNNCGNGSSSPIKTIAINQVPPTPSIINYGQTISSSSVQGNQWYFTPRVGDEGATISGANNQIYLPTQNGWYWTNTTQNGCSSEFSKRIHHLMSGEKSVLNVYPIPNNGQFTISVITAEEQIYTISIYNQAGQKIYELFDLTINGTFEHLVNLGAVSSGVYSIIFRNNDGQEVRKMTINQ